MTILKICPSYCQNQIWSNLAPWNFKFLNIMSFQCLKSNIKSIPSLFTCLQNIFISILFLCCSMLAMILILIRMSIIGLAGSNTINSPLQHISIYSFPNYDIIKIKSNYQSWCFLIKKFNMSCLMFLIK